MEGVKSRFVPVPKIKETPLRWYLCGSCMCVGTLKRRGNVARRTMFPRLAPSLCKLKKEITPLMRKVKMHVERKEKKTRRPNHLALKQKMLVGFYAMREPSQ